MINYFPARISYRKATVLIIGAVVLVWPLFAQEPSKTQVKPGPVYPVQRYETLWKSSLFGKSATTTAAKTSAEWNLAGVFEIDGKKSAILMNERTGAVENVTVEAANSSGIKLVTVQTGGIGAPPRVEISQNGKTQWVTARKIQPTGVQNTATPNRALVNSRAGTPVPRRDDTKSDSQANAQRVTPQNLAPPSPLDVPANDVPIPDSTGAVR